MEKEQTKRQIDHDRNEDCWSDYCHVDIPQKDNFFEAMHLKI
jgi:hypothetical protein